MASIVDPEHINVVCYAFVVALILWIFYNCTRIYTWTVMHKAVSRGTYYQYTYEELRSTSLKQKVLDDVREGAGQMIQLLPITPLRFYLRQQQISLQVIPQSDLAQTPTLRKGVFTEGVFSPTDGSRAFVFEGRPPVLPSAVATPQSGLSPGSTMFHHVRNGGSSSMDYSNWAAPGSAVMHPQVSSGGFDLFGTPSTVLQDNGFGAQPLWMGFDVAVHQATHTRSIAASALLTVNTSDLLKELWQSLVVPTQVSDGLPHASPPPTRRLWGGLVKFMSRVSVGSSNKRPLVTPMSTIRPPRGTIRRRGNSIIDMLRTPKSTALSQSTSADFHSAVSSAVGTPTTAGRDSEFPKGNDLLPTVGKKGTESSNFQRTLSSHLGPLSSSGQTIPMLRADGGVGELVPPALRLQDRGSASIRSADYDSANSPGNIDRNLTMSGSDAHASITSPLQARRGRQPLTIEVPQLTNFTPPLRPTPETRPPPREPCTPTSALVSDLPSALSDGSMSSPNQPSTSHQYPPPHYRSIAFANPMFADQLTQLEFLAEATTTAPQADSLDAALQKRGGIVERMIDTVEDTLSSRRWAPLDGSNDSPMFSSPSSFDDVTIPIVVVVEELPPVVASRRIGLIYTSTVSQSTVAQLASPSEAGGQTPAPLFDLQLSFMRIGTDLFRIYPIYNASTEDGGGTAGKRPCKYGGVDGIPVRCGGGPNFQKRQQNGVTDSFEHPQSPTSIDSSQRPKALVSEGSGNAQHTRTFSESASSTSPHIEPKKTLMKSSLKASPSNVALGAKNGVVSLSTLLATPPVQSASGSNESHFANDPSDKQVRLPKSTFDLAESTSTTDDDADLCVICYVEPKAVITMPCAHYAVCMNCVKRLKECSLCRKPILETIFLLRPVVYLQKECREAQQRLCSEAASQQQGTKCGKRRVEFNMNHHNPTLTEDERLNITGEGDLPTPSSRTASASTHPGALSLSLTRLSPRANDGEPQTASQSDQEYIERLIRQLQGRGGGSSATAVAGNDTHDLPSLFEFDLDETVMDLISNLRDRLKKSKATSKRREGNPMSSSFSFLGSHSEMTQVPISPLAATAAPSPSNSVSQSVLESKRKSKVRTVKDAFDHNTSQASSSPGAALHTGSDLSPRADDSPHRMSATMAMPAASLMSAKAPSPASDSAVGSNQIEFEVVDEDGGGNRTHHRRVTHRQREGETVEMDLIGLPDTLPSLATPAAFSIPLSARLEEPVEQPMTNESCVSAISLSHDVDAAGMGLPSGKASTANKSFHSVMEGSNNTSLVWGGSLQQSLSPSPNNNAVNDDARHAVPGEDQESQARNGGGMTGGLRSLASRIWGAGVNLTHHADPHTQLAKNATGTPPQDAS